MQSTLNEADSTVTWTQLAPHLEAAMDKLAERDRTMLALRFYENKTAAEAAAALNLTEAAANKRATRAVEKLRKIFAQRGVTLTTTAIAGAVSANSVQAALVALVKTISAVAVAKGAAATTSTLTLVKGALKNYGVDKNADGNRHRRGNLTRGRNNNCNRQSNSRTQDASVANR